MNKKYEVVAHTADMQLLFFGSNKEELFENAIYGMFHSIQPEYASNTILEHEVNITADNNELLLVDFLSEALYLSDAERIAFKQAKIIELTDTLVKATLFGCTINKFERGEIKAVTYHNLKITYHDNQWMAQVVFDI